MEIMKNEKKEAAMFQVKDIMTKDVFTLNKRDSSSAAKDLMDLARIRHIPIVDNLGKLRRAAHPPRYPGRDSLGPGRNRSRNPE